MSSKPGNVCSVLILSNPGNVGSSSTSSISSNPGNVVSSIGFFLGLPLPLLGPYFTGFTS